MGRLAGFCLVTTLSLLPVWSQEFRASISGEVRDTSGAPAPEVKVIARHQASNLVYEATTNEAGRYLLNFLQPGDYTLTAERAGFKKFVREGVKLLLSDRASLDITLDVGSLAESVTVTGSVSELQTESAVRIATVERAIIERAPNNGRNPFLLTHALPGVEKTGYWGSAELYAYGQVGGVSISGGRAGENETVIDGVTNTRPSRGVNFIPALDTLAEVSVQTNVYDAQFARTSGGVNVFGTKSGTNTIHGALYEHLKHENFIANGWSRNKAVGELLASNPNAIVPAKKFRNNTFGFEIDGPLYIPKLIDGRNKIFFLISMEGLRERNPSTQARTLPTAEQLTGDFSNLRTGSGAGQPVVIYDPLTTDRTSALRAPFAGNRIPTNRINPIAAKVASFYPKPNAPGETAAALNNYINVSPSKNGYNQWVGKLDYRINSKNTVFFRRGETPWENFSRVVWGNNEAEPSGEAPSTRRAISYSADWTSTLTPTLVFNLRGGLARTENYSGNIYGVGYDPRKLGFSDALVSQFDTIQFPRFTIGAYSELGTAPASADISDTWSVQPNVSWVRGKHTMKIGLELRLYNQNNIGPGYASGTYTFSRAWTQQNAQRADALSGNDFASFLLGNPASGSVDRNINTAFSWKYYGIYIQDDWKITRRLTLNLGARWDYEAPAAERFNRMIRGFAFDQASPIASRVQGLTLKGGLQYAGTSGENRQAFNRDLNNFQPRIGAAFKLDNKTVLRGGYGLVYLGQNATGATTGYSRSTGIITTADGGLTPRVTLGNPFPEGLLQPIGNTQGLSTNLGLGASFQYLNRPLPYSQQYSFGFQRELPWSMVADVSYVGNQARKLPISVDYNFHPLNEVGKASSYYTERLPNPMAGLLPDNSAKNGATIPRQDLLLPYPQYTGVSASNVPIGKQRYDAMQSSITKRFSNGVTFRFNYTIAKTLEQVNLLNPQDFNAGDISATRLEKRLVDYDAPRHLGLLGTADLPFGRGRKFARGLHPIAQFFLGGWNLAANFNKRSGLPLAFPNAAPIRAGSAKLSTAQRDEIAKQYGKDRWDISYMPYIDTTLFPKTAALSSPLGLRDYPTRFPDVRSFGMTHLDCTVSKEWVIRERVRFMFRAETMNTLNTVYFKALTGTNVTSSNFGFLNQDPTQDPRMTVMVLRMTF